MVQAGGALRAALAFSHGAAVAMDLELQRFLPCRWDPACMLSDAVSDAACVAGAGQGKRNVV